MTRPSPSAAHLAYRIMAFASASTRPCWMSSTGAFRKKLYGAIAELQADLDQWLRHYEVRTHQGRWCYGKTPMQTFLDRPANGPRKS